MGEIHLELADISGGKGAVEPMINFEFRTLSIGFSSLGRDAKIFNIVCRGSISAGTHAGLDLPPMDIQIPVDARRLNNIDMLHGTLTLSDHALERIEEMRQEYEEDLELALTFEMVAKQPNKEEIARDRMSSTVTISSYQWEQVLDDLDFHSRRVIELEFHGDPESQAALENAHAKIEQAQGRHDSGDYKGAIEACRDAVESLQQVDDDLVAKAIDDTRRDELEKQLGGFEKGFLGTFSHSEDKTGINTVLPRDSTLAIGLTKSFMTYYAEAIKELADSGTWE